MRIEITKPGIYGAGGEIAVGTELTVKDEPKGWAGRYRVVGGGAKGKTAVTNPVDGGAKGYAVVQKSPGWFVVTKDGMEVTKAMRKADLEGFDAMSDEDKGAFADLHAPEA
jgi:hypothetical protein